MDKCITAEGHIIGMLDRDQRTAKLRYLPIDNHVANLYTQTTLSSSLSPSLPLLSNCHRQNNTIHHHPTITNINRVISHRNIPGRTSPHSSCKTRKNQQLWKSLLRLEHVFLLIIYINLITFPTIRSAPVKTDKTMPRSETPIWINPCGAPPPTTVDDGEAVPVSELISQIVNQANIAISQAKVFATKFLSYWGALMFQTVSLAKPSIDVLSNRKYRVIFNITDDAQKSFSMEPEKLQDYWKNVRYEWLPGLNEIPKELGQQLNDDNFGDLQINETLLNVYQYLQKIAVGVEQIVWDEEEQKGEFESEFKQIEGNLRNLLCEIQTAIYELRLKPKDDVNRNIMPDNLRQMDKTGTNMRNWLIYRDYMNAVEYIIQVFKYFQKHTKA